MRQTQIAFNYFYKCILLMYMLRKAYVLVSHVIKYEIFCISSLTFPIPLRLFTSKTWSMSKASDNVLGQHNEMSNQY